MYVLLLFNLFFVIQINAKYNNANNVCKTFEDYATIETNTNCYYNPDADSTPQGIAKRYGYPFEKYRVKTEDGYILSLYRIPHNNVDKEKVRQPIILQHGIAITSVAWMLIGKRSLAFYLADRGYDVWLPNIRGVQYSTSHVNLTVNNPLYWNFSFHEMGVYDVPAIINFVARVTSQSGKIVYVGHSMGSTMSYIYSSLMPDHAEKHLRGLISLAPIANLKNIRSVAKLLVPFADTIQELLNTFGINAIGQFPQLQRSLTQATCGRYPVILLCEILNLALVGVSDGQVAPDVIPIFLSHYPSGTSVRTLLHFAQIINSGGKFQMYDFGPTSNMKTYNSSIPPEYPIKNINIPVHLIGGSEDYLSEINDVKVTYNNLRTKKSLHVMNENGKYHFAHNDYLLGSHIEEFKSYLFNLLTSELK